MQKTAPQGLPIWGPLLDGLDVAVCLFDASDCTLGWNRSFLRLFPEHDGHVHIGEPYSANLRRFYAVRLAPDELSQIDRYIEAGVARHRAQMRPFLFEHHGRRIQAASLPFENGGRVRVWRAERLPANDQTADLLDLAAAPSALPPAHALLLDRVPDGLMICNSAGCIEWVNEPFVRMYDLPQRSIALGITMRTVLQSLWTRAGAPDAPQCLAGLNLLQENLRFSGAPFELALPGGRYIRVTARPADGQSVFYAHVDISELKHQQWRLQEAERLTRHSETALRHQSALLLAMLENMEQGVTMLSTDGALEMYNLRAAELLHLPPQHAGERLQPAISDNHRQGQAAYARSQAMLNLEPILLPDPGTTTSVQSRSPDSRVLEVRTVPVEGSGFLRTFSDITDRYHEEARMRHAANHDGLTGLLNRSTFMSHLVVEIARVRRSGGGCAVLYLDLDGFKPVNDQHGHAVGDRALIWVAQCLLRIARESDLVARLGGDEFVVLQKSVDDPAHALAFGQRLLAAINESFMIETLQLRMGASIGVSHCPLHSDVPQQLLDCADKAMYRAKAQGRNAVCLFDPTASEASD